MTVLPRLSGAFAIVQTTDRQYHAVKNFSPLRTADSDAMLQRHLALDTTEHWDFRVYMMTHHPPNVEIETV